MILAAVTSSTANKLKRKLRVTSEVGFPAPYFLLILYEIHGNRLLKSS